MTGSGKSKLLTAGLAVFSCSLPCSLCMLLRCPTASGRLVSAVLCDFEKLLCVFFGGGLGLVIWDFGRVFFLLLVWFGVLGGFWKKVPVHSMLKFLISGCVFLTKIGFPVPLATVKRTH